MSPTYAVVYEAITDADTEKRLSEIAEKAFLFIGAATGSAYWFNPLTSTYYREWTCNGPSSWSIGKVT